MMSLNESQNPIDTIVFDWGDTLMRVFPEFPGRMADWPKIDLMPGVEACLRQLPEGLTLVVASNAEDSTAHDIERALERVAIAGDFDHVFAWRDLGSRKPSPVFYASLLRKLGNTAVQCLAVGDSLKDDVLPAVATGMCAVLVCANPSEGSLSDEYAVIATLEHLPGLLAR